MKVIISSPFVFPSLVVPIRLPEAGATDHGYHVNVVVKTRINNSRFSALRGLTDRNAPESHSRLGHPVKQEISEDRKFKRSNLTIKHRVVRAEVGHQPGTLGVRATKAARPQWDHAHWKRSPDHHPANSGRRWNFQTSPSRRLLVHDTAGTNYGLELATVSSSALKKGETK